MIRPFYVHETWHTSWYWRLGKIEIEVYKPAYRDASLYWVSLRDSDGSPGFYTPLFAVSWLTHDKPTRLPRPRKPRVAQERVPAPKDRHG